MIWIIVLDDMIADMLSNKKRNSIVTELFIRDRKLNISPVLIRQSCFLVPKNIKLNSTHYLFYENSKQTKLQQIAFNHLSDIDFKEFLNLYNKCTVNHTLF